MHIHATACSAVDIDANSAVDIDADSAVDIHESDLLSKKLLRGMLSHVQVVPAHACQTL